MIRYRTKDDRIEITAITTSRVLGSDKHVMKWGGVLDGPTPMLCGDGYDYFDTWEEAHAHLVDRTERALATAGENAAVYERDLSALREMKVRRAAAQACS